MNSLLGQSIKWRKEADKILSLCKLVDILKGFGRVEFSGAYAANLMMSGDIDVYVISKTSRKGKVLEAFNQIANSCPFQGYLFYDWKNNKHPGFPHAYYIGLKTKIRGAKWKIDVWFLTEKDLRKVKYHYLKDVKLKQEQKLAILRFKQFRNKHLPKLPSFFIYEAVLKDNIVTLSGFKEYIGKFEKKF